ncbi:MAG: beta-ketoacyl synthase N-terminal-like domain-containing protein, partial [Myxococcota bacterium]|nr:beta-ketoacyl synthase N-terminal-like domain-containing protein [Myxococcota bacterium]
INELYLGDSDLVLTGGVDTTNDPFLFMCFSKTPALSPSGDCRPFSSEADGTMLGEGIGFVALKRLEDAERDGDRVYAVIKGVGTSSDGRAKSVYAPRPSGQAIALRRAYERAGYGPETVELIEAHGTGTAAGDLAEFGGLRQVFEETGRDDKRWCGLGSVKSQIGHTKSAAGAAGLIKAALALNHKVLPPTIKVTEPREALDVAHSPFYLNTKARPWIRGADHPRRASVSSFGFGGTNFHVALEAYEGPADQAWRRRAWPSQLVLLSAADAATLAEESTSLAESCKGTEALTWIARSSQQRFDATATHRLAVVASSPEELTSALQMAAARLASSPDEGFSLPNGVTYGVGPAEPGQIAFLFPGQGSQRIDMGA